MLLEIYVVFSFLYFRKVLIQVMVKIMMMRLLSMFLQGTATLILKATIVEVKRSKASK